MIKIRSVLHDNQPILAAVKAYVYDFYLEFYFYSKNIVAILLTLGRKSD